jgi:hypothetical protein
MNISEFPIRPSASFLGLERTPERGRNTAVKKATSTNNSQTYKKWKQNMKPVGRKEPVKV